MTLKESANAPVKAIKRQANLTNPGDRALEALLS